MQADEAQEVLPGVFIWQAYDRSVKTDLSSAAVVIGAELVFIDPIPLKKRELAKLAQAYRPSSIVLTNGNHARAAEAFREEFQVPIVASEAACGPLGLEVDQIVKEEAPVLGELQVIELPGFGEGEIALYREGAGGLMIVGDALINVESHGFIPLPEKYCQDARQGKSSLEKLLQFRFGALIFAHGLPIVSQARSRLESLLK